MKTIDCFNNCHYNKCLNYLKISENKLAILANFNLLLLEYKYVSVTKKKYFKICVN
ncbi:GxxExxY protein [Flavobacterium sp.]|uniref:GxxExxY protein n=1 Tax=Flavobacterium sp. TaxID=239 RepID=UPI004047371E